MEKILIIHNEYQQIGGEDVAVSKEIDILSNYFEIDTLIFNNNIKNQVSLILSFLLVTNFYSNYLLKNKLKEFNPDLVYVHNTWFKVSLGIFKILKKRNIKTVVKLHNFRYFCTKSFFKFHHVKKGKICNACGARGDKLSLFNKYFDNSVLKSLLVNQYGRKYFKILKEKELSKIVLTNHHKKFLKELGIVEGVYVNPNFKPYFNKSSIYEKENLIVYAGRISEEKGVKELINAFLNSGIDDLKLKIIGNGPLLKSLLDIKYKNIEFLGEKENKEVLEIIQNSFGVITATKLYEGQPTLLCEASSLGVPSIFPNTGGISEFFPEEYLLTFEQFNYKDLERKINLLYTSREHTLIGEENKEFILNQLDKNNLISSFSQIAQND